MKIATLTFHRAVNYGAVLQAVALCQALKNRFPDCESGILDYHNEKIEKKFRPFFVKKKKNPIGTVKSVIHAFMAYPVRSKKKKKFEEFLENNASLIPFTTDEEKNAALREIDRYIVGSDQVWNFDLSGNDETYLLGFIAEKEKKGAYAPSIGKTELTESEYSKLQAVKDFGYLSAREETASDIIENITGSKPALVPDPVFLLSKEEWRAKEEKYKGIPEKYVLIYKFADNDKKMTQFAYDYAKKNNCEIVIVQSSLKNADGAKVVRDASPGEFLWLIDNAQCVVTNSFHGTAFSILFEKEFYSEANVARGTRIKEVLRLYGLEGQLMLDGVKAGRAVSESRDKVSEHISFYRTNAFEYLDRIVGKN